jgi:hypothetical protein
MLTIPTFPILKGKIKKAGEDHIYPELQPPQSTPQLTPRVMLHLKGRGKCLLPFLPAFTWNGQVTSSIEIMGMAIESPGQGRNVYALRIRREAQGTVILREPSSLLYCADVGHKLLSELTHSRILHA